MNAPSRWRKWPTLGPDAPTSHPWRLLLVSALGMTLGCTVSGPSLEPIELHTAEYSADAVQFRFDVHVREAWAWYIMLDTDQMTDASGHKTGLGEFGEEFRVRSYDQIADSVAVRPTSGPVDPSPGAGGWPLPVGFAHLDPSAAVSLTIPKAILADDGRLSYNIKLITRDGSALFYDKSGVTTPRPVPQEVSRK